jgi:hypothetical protein
VLKFTFLNFFPSFQKSAFFVNFEKIRCLSFSLKFVWIKSEILSFDLENAIQKTGFQFLAGLQKIFMKYFTTKVINL